MTTDQPTKTIEFPPTNTEKLAKLKRFLETTAEFMNCEIEVEAVTILQARIPADRTDLLTMLQRVSKAQKEKKS